MNSAGLSESNTAATATRSVRQFRSIFQSSAYNRLLDSPRPDVLCQVQDAVDRTSDLSEAIRLMGR
jgi:hypothetical protein